MKNQREDVRQRITDCAKEEFLLYGYSGSSMRNISNQAGMTVGNVYAYFSGKEDLFNQVVLPARKAIESLISVELAPHMSVGEITSAVVEVFLNHRTEFLILLNGSAGSPYENVREDLVRLIAHRVSVELLPRVEQEKERDPLLTMAVVAALVEGFLRIFNNYGGDVERLKSLVSKMLSFVLGIDGVKLYAADLKGEEGPVWTAL